jgi:DNA-binding transcriptional ArsR family regulator
VDNLDAILGAISHPSRRAIMARLTTGPARVTEIAEPFDMSLNAVSKHLKVLEQARLIHREKRGRDHFIELRAEPLREVAAFVHEYERFWNRHLDRVEQFFKEKRERKS